MSKNRDGLVAVKRMDRNGKFVTRHVKPDAAFSAGAKAMPAPRLTKRTITAANRADLINEAAGHIKPADTLKKTLERASDEMIKTLDEALTVYGAPSSDPAVIREKQVIQKALHSLARGSADDDKLVHEMLALRSAFCSPWAVENDAPISNSLMKEFFYGYGIRSGQELSLTPKWVAGLSAFVRFAYEMKERCPDADFLPTVQKHVNIGGHNRTHPAQVYRDTDTANFIFTHAQQTTELIEIAIKHQTSDAKMLDYLLESGEASKAVSSGWL